MSVLALAENAGVAGEAVGPPAGALFPGLIQSAQLELQASLQLLVERARFLTGARGVAIALKEGEQFAYQASAGTLTAEDGNSADLDRELLRNCIASAKPVRLSQEARDEADSFYLAVPILRAESFVGFFELTTRDAEFSHEDIDAVARLAVFAETALDHAMAAEETERRIFAPEIEFSEPLVADPQTLWHAPEQVAAPAPAVPAPAAQSDIKFCASCNFPVSPGRNLCVDCERDPSAAATLAAPPLFAGEKQESWVEAHGYTVASILVSALAAAIIYWLR